MLMASDQVDAHMRISECETDETNALIAETVFGYKVRKSSNGRFRIWWADRSNQMLDVQSVPKFLQDAAADYQVLSFVRQNWSQQELAAFHTEFAIVVSRRLNLSAGNVTSPFFYYHPGDFSRAALAVAVDPPLIQEYSLS